VLPGAVGLWWAIGGFAVGFVLSSLAVSIVVGPSGSLDSLGATVASLAGLWTGFLGAAFGATRSRGGLRPVLGLGLRLWPDVPLGLVVGVATQLLVVPLLYLPVGLFVHHLSEKLSVPANRLVGTEHGASLAVISVLVVVGAPIVEEIFFRGLLLRSLRSLTGTVLAVVLSSLAFGLAHAESLQLLGLAAFGVVLALLAIFTRRLGAGIVAHAAFNLTAVLSIAVIR
jgi:membrane protease YdiL (CAAX protease family)